MFSSLQSWQPRTLLTLSSQHLLIAKAMSSLKQSPTDVKCCNIRKEKNIGYCKLATHCVHHYNCFHCSPRGSYKTVTSSNLVNKFNVFLVMARIETSELCQSKNEPVSGVNRQSIERKRLKGWFVYSKKANTVLKCKMHHFLVQEKIVPRENLVLKLSSCGLALYHYVGQRE